MRASSEKSVVGRPPGHIARTGLIVRWTSHAQRALLFLAVALLCIDAALAQTAEPLRLGVFAYRPHDVMVARYRPLADYLSTQLGGRQVELQILEQTEMEAALAEDRLDLVFTNPSHYMLLRSRNTLGGALVTQVSLEDGVPTAFLGGVILTRADRDDLQQLGDLGGKRVAIPGPRYLGGYQAQAYEFLKAGIDVASELELFETGRHDKVIEAVLAGEADAGFVRTGVIESLRREGHLAADAIKLINPRSHPRFPYLVSTDLYPEWAFLALPHVDNLTVRRVGSALLGLKPEDAAARAAGIEGFAPPADYLPVENLARALRVPPFDAPPRFTLADLWQQHRLWIVLLATFATALLAVSLTLVLRNRDLRAAKRSLELAASVFSHAREGIMITDSAGDIVDVNASFSRITGYSREEVLGRNPRLMNSGQQDADFYAHMWSALLATGHWQGEAWNRHKQGHLFAESINISAVRDGGGKVRNFVALFSDITTLKEHQQQLEQIAHYDALTGLPNRVLFAERLQQAIIRSQRRRDRLCVAYLDLDGFKQINDLHGHDSGDALLRVVAQRMRNVLRESDIIARLGGDEFVVVLPELNAAEDCIPVLERILAAAATTVQVRSKALQVSASMGVAIFPEDGVDGELLVRQADQAMYAAKQAGRNRYRFNGQDRMGTRPVCET